MQQKAENSILVTWVQRGILVLVILMGLSCYRYPPLVEYLKKYLFVPIYVQLSIVCLVWLILRQVQRSYSETVDLLERENEDVKR